MLATLSQNLIPEPTQHTGVTSIGILFQIVATLCELESRLGDNVVEGEGTAAESLTGVAMASK